MNFELDSQTRRELGYRLIDEVDKFFSSLPDRPVQRPAECRTYAAHLDPCPQRAEDPGKIFNDIFQQLLDDGFHIPSAHYLGMMNPTPTYMAFLGESLVSALNPQLANLARSQLASRIEAETVRWVGGLIGWPGEFGGTFTSGGNEANFSALAMAMAAHFPDIVETGVGGIGGQPVFYASSESHHSLDKSAGLLGIGRKALRRIPVNRDLQLDIEKLEHTIRADIRAGYRPFCIVATAGTTSSGAIDDLTAIAGVCQRYNLWFHVDGAYGAALLFSRKHRDMLRGIAAADSITFDPHKWLAMPFSSGLIFTQHPEIMHKTFSVPCPYLQKATTGPLPDNMSISAQWSRRMNSLKLWLTLKVHGREGYEALVDRQMEMAKEFAEWVGASDEFQLAAPQTLPILNLRIKHWHGSSKELDFFHHAIIEDVNRDGQRWISSAVVNERVVIRTMIISYLTELRHVQGLQRALLSAVSKSSSQTVAA